MTSGRLRTHDRDQIARDLVEWAKLTDSVNLNAFCATKLITPRKISEWSKEEEFFRESVEIAKAFLACRREKMLSENKLHVKGYDINVAVYDYFVAQERRDSSKFDSELRKTEQSQASTVNVIYPSNGVADRE